MQVRKLVVLAALASVVGGSSAQASFLINGDFETYTGGFNGNPSQLNDTGTGGYSRLTGWTVGPGSSSTFGFLMNPATHDTTGSRSVRFDGNFTLWGPNNGSANGLTGSPTGGLYVAIDADATFRGTGISQVVTGLTAGGRYRVEFDWAAAQQSGFDGPTTEQVQVTFGSQTQVTSIYNLPNHGFSGWRHQAFDFTADGTTQTLNFLALGGPGGLPPFVLLDGLSLNPTSTPEPATALTLGMGLAGLGGVGLRRRLRAKAA